MSSRSVGTAPLQPVVRARHRASLPSTLAALAGALLLTGLVLAARPPIGAASAQPAGPGTPAQAMAASSALLAQAVAPGGAGFGFFAVQRTVEQQRAGGPAIPVPDPADDRRVIGQTDRLLVNTMMSRGVLTPDGFLMEMRLGTPSSASAADFDGAVKVFSVLARDGTTWRDDGAGWYATDQLPGMGFDLATARLLPRALGRLGSLQPAGTDTVGGAQVWAFTATVAVADYPGAVAADGAAFTDPAVSVKAWVDAGGRLVRLWTRARNTSQTVWDLWSETTIDFGAAAAGDLPLPDPAAAPDPAAGR